MLKTKQINDFTVSKIALPKISEKKIRGSELLPLYSNTFICAKKNSGKTTVIFNVLKKCADRDTVLHLFVSTIEKDPSWLQIVKYFQNKNLQVHTHTSTRGEDAEDLIQEIIDTPVDHSDQESSESEDETVSFISIDEPEKEKKRKKRKKRKPSKLAQKQIIVLDDIGMELRGKTIDQILKINRHLKSKVIISSQYLNDLSPQARRQIDIWLLFAGCKKEKLSTILRDSDCPLEYPVFEHMYKHATRQKYNFLYLNAHNCTYRQNFNLALLPEAKE